MSEAEISSALTIDCQHTHKVAFSDAFVRSRPEPDHLREEARQARLAWEVDVLAAAAPAKITVAAKTPWRL